MGQRLLANQKGRNWVKRVNLGIFSEMTQHHVFMQKWPQATPTSSSQLKEALAGRGSMDESRER